MREQLQRTVEKAIEPNYREKVNIEWNSLDQLVVKLPPDINYKTVNKCIDFESMNEVKEQENIYESVQIKSDTLTQAFSQHKAPSSERL